MQVKPTAMSATRAARASSGRHLLLNLARARYVAPEDEDTRATQVLLGKKKAKALKRKQAKDRKRVSA